MTLFESDQKRPSSSDIEGRKNKARSTAFVKKHIARQGLNEAAQARANSHNVSLADSPHEIADASINEQQATAAHAIASTSTFPSSAATYTPLSPTRPASFHTTSPPQSSLDTKTFYHVRYSANQPCIKFFSRSNVMTSYLRKKGEGRRYVLRKAPVARSITPERHVEVGEQDAIEMTTRDEADTETRTSSITTSTDTDMNDQDAGTPATTVGGSEDGEEADPASRKPLDEMF
ncbi:hypothetical protein OHC33_004153 [Knufia fluminis]|uniref:Uncharacterized protein n=1 Tax=Knufia fluminis TaxID=191047 RepID=A0AAN8FAA0_9EURO|nr:hypothetical protein OHC33_004153 [Knufia fluminis]